MLVDKEMFDYVNTYRDDDGEDCQLVWRISYHGEDGNRGHLKSFDGPYFDIKEAMDAYGQFELDDEVVRITLDNAEYLSVYDHHEWEEVETLWKL